jgi:hypothetical protein
MAERIIRQVKRIRSEVTIVTSAECEQCGGTGLNVVLMKVLEDGRSLFGPDVCYCAEIRASNIDG